MSRLRRVFGFGVLIALSTFSVCSAAVFASGSASDASGHSSFLEVGSSSGSDMSDEDHIATPSVVRDRDGKG